MTAAGRSKLCESVCAPALSASDSDAQKYTFQYSHVFPESDAIDETHKHNIKADMANCSEQCTQNERIFLAHSVRNIHEQVGVCERERER